VRASMLVRRGRDRHSATPRAQATASPVLPWRTLGLAARILAQCTLYQLPSPVQPSEVRAFDVGSTARWADGVGQGGGEGGGPGVRRGGGGMPSRGRTGSRRRSPGVRGSGGDQRDRVDQGGADGRLTGGSAGRGRGAMGKNVVHEYSQKCIVKFRFASMFGCTYRGTHRAFQ